MASGSWGYARPSVGGLGWRRNSWERRVRQKAELGEKKKKKTQNIFQPEYLVFSAVHGQICFCSLLQLIPLPKAQLMMCEELGPTQKVPSTLGQTFPQHKSPNSSTMNHVSLTRRCFSRRLRPISFTTSRQLLFFGFFLPAVINVLFQGALNDLATSRCWFALSFKSRWLWVGYVAEEARQWFLPGSHQGSAAYRCSLVVGFGQQVSIRKVFSFFATWFEVETSMFLWVSGCSRPFAGSRCDWQSARITHSLTVNRRRGFYFSFFPLQS